ncbi:MAG: NAD(P)-dependent glycerol-1-phosphate dehydrogenase [Candidatus Altiarchaeales archaeon IMC4]|nr:MAG: NAD(P)-dependent glycerol-1-phosphate dehydrogenase [Candidatus Altiarchaeales archaeon IMC4]
MKSIELPRKVVIGDGAINKIKDICSSIGLEGNALIITGPTTNSVAGKTVKRILDGDAALVKESSADEIASVLDKIGGGFDFLAGVGGGNVIDFTKICSFRSGVPFVSVPTSASHDGIASPLVSLKFKSVKEMGSSTIICTPSAVVADTEIIRKAPKRLLAAGCADAISNYTAVLDWELAHKEKNTYYGDYAASLSMMSARIVMEKAPAIKDDINILVEALISSGVAIGIAGSSHPCSGSEHMFSHSLDEICEKPALHGEQCGVGTIMMAYLHGANWKQVRNALQTVGAPTNAKELGIPESDIIKALTKAHEVRDRYTILRTGIARDDAEKLAQVTGVI